MSKKTNAAKMELARRKNARKKPRRAKRPKAKGLPVPFACGFPLPMFPPFSVDPFGVLRFLSRLVGMPPTPVWYCAPCKSELQLIHGSADGEVFCPKCRQPMRLYGKQERQAADGSIEVTFEPIPVTAIPANALQIAAPKEPSK